MSKVVFYARVSTKDQRPDLQLDAARRLGVATASIFVEKASGIRRDRPELTRALATLQPGTRSPVSSSTGSAAAWRM
jgi:DNA invertase Pin-like site-specific DNA recombinase